ncbi:T9SS type B sorting domain-containing protein [Cryomorpha ignava]|uniref:T9SS type B sorting domain-containing protein n=1 Tax=Cryomorpha ignava TaxID=101383 RepID=A0A7K3WS72_9FLAO|nr:gliding motility-associated C-terminal domain-containing protein [Cryomorpha ignava]NEN23702.1 T9SS type B sorting domain-containing protein [Cryomorpha ignava]
MKLFSVFTFLLLFSFTAFSQNNNGIIRCGTDERHEILMQDSAYAAQFAEKNQKIETYLKSHNSEMKADCDEILYLPVAVHFQDVGIDYACALEMALSQVESINQDYGGTNPDINKWTEGRTIRWPQIQNGESCVEFCLATLNHPAGSGIAEGDYAVTLNEYGPIDDIPQWSGYINFFVRNMNGGVLGYSPLGGDGNGDGVVCGITSFGSVSCGGNTLMATYNMGRTVTHELGHYLSLNHPFNNPDCAIDGDGIADTPITNAATYGCYAIGEELINCTDPILWPSYMDYCDDACLYMFSQGQTDQLTAYVNTSLQTLLNNATTKCEDAACINFEASFQSSNETCEGNDGRIIFQASGGTEPYIYSITNGVTDSENPDFNNIIQGKYFLNIIDQQGCEFIDSVEIARDTPQMELVSSKNSFCGDNSGSLIVKVKYDADFEYSIQGVSGWQDTAYFASLSRGEYTVLAQTASGCTPSLDVTIGDDTDLSFVIRSVHPVNCPLFDNGLIDVLLSGGEEPIKWQLNEGNRSDKGFYDRLGAGDYNLSVEDGRGCRLDRDFKIGVSYLEIGDDCPCDMYIPNAMTPDGDGLNDLLVVVPSCPISNFNMQIFDRWGKIVFESEDLETRWNGGLDGYFVEPGIYFYRITYRWGEKFNESLEVQTENGYVQILR